MNKTVSLVFLSSFRNMLWRGGTPVKQRRNWASPRFLATLSRVLPRHNMFLKLDWDTREAVLFLYYYTRPMAYCQWRVSCYGRGPYTHFRVCPTISVTWHRPLVQFRLRFTFAWKIFFQTVGVLSGTPVDITRLKVRDSVLRRHNRPSCSGKQSRRATNYTICKHLRSAAGSISRQRGFLMLAFKNKQIWKHFCYNTFKYFKIHIVLVIDT